MPWVSKVFSSGDHDSVGRPSALWTTLDRKIMFIMWRWWYRLYCAQMILNSYFFYFNISFWTFFIKIKRGGAPLSIKRGFSAGCILHARSRCRVRYAPLRIFTLFVVVVDAFLFRKLRACVRDSCSVRARRRYARGSVIWDPGQVGKGRLKCLFL